MGGGIVIVPAVAFYLQAAGIAPGNILHLALGTSLGVIVFTSISSFRAHHKRGAVDWSIVLRISGGILAGTYLGSWVAAQLSTRFLAAFFVVFLYLVALQMLLEARPKPSRHVPGWTGTSLVGLFIGGVSALVGIGGGSLSVPFMTWCNLPIHGPSAPRRPSACPSPWPERRATLSTAGASPTCPPTAWASSTCPPWWASPWSA